MSNRSADLGDKVRHKITGFEGIVTSYAKHLTGCDRLWIDPPVDRDGKLVDGMWVDIDMLDIIEPEKIQRVKYTREAPGGVDLPRSR